MHASPVRPNQTAVSAIDARKSLVIAAPATQTPVATIATTVGMLRRRAIRA